MRIRDDAVGELVGFARRLRADGLAVDLGRVAATLRALASYGVLGSDDLYWSTRLTLCSRREDVPTFDTAYRAWFGLTPPTVGVAPLRRDADRAGASAVDTVAADDAADSPMPGSAGFVEQLRMPPRLSLSPTDIAETSGFIADLTRAYSQRRTSRRVPGGRGSLDVPRVARTMMRHGCEPLRLSYRRPARQRRRLVLLIDVSKSMEDHRSLLLRFAYAAVTAAPATTEVFTVGTRLDRITALLRRPDPQAAMDALADRRADWDAGTRLGAAVTTFTQTWGEHRMVRAANLVLFSDGWEPAGPAPLVAQIARLARLAHRVIWACPDTAEPNFTPVAPALVESLRYVHLVAAHDPAALRTLTALLACTTCGPRCPRHRQPANWRVSPHDRDIPFARPRHDADPGAAR
ncbi:VWA domain-containing protein [Verrucosispora sp. WMMA2044]|uniref:VWA domain-containing protein n=1 Tax=Verrucosispora sp. WMMA2044 TaxID=3016419 RepID=UPI00248B39FD|nr:VWA domain-containing protein [Verrucosispora sp. WMMA2044]WBB50162.1 VWA domain-containing protein [Verrucosispora sp. WMMA2044]